MIQWGILTFSQSSSSFSVSNLINYTSELTYSIFLQSAFVGETETSNNQYWNSQRIQSKTKNSFGGNIASENQTSLNWLTIGY